MTIYNGRILGGILAILAAVVALFLSEGCVGAGRVFYNNPETAQAQASSSSYLFDPRDGLDTLIHLELPEADIAVRGGADTISILVSPPFVPLPLIPWLPGILILLSDDEKVQKIQFDSRQLYLRFRFSPKTEQVTFNPEMSIVLTHEGKLVVPTRQAGPGPLTGLGPLQTGTFSMRLQCAYKDFENITNVEIPITGQTCLTLEYPLPVLPSQPFTLLINGLFQAGRQVPVPPIQFEQASYFGVYRFF